MTSLPINTGCLGACTYCKTVHARGRLGSYSKEALVQRVRSVIAEDVREIWMSSEDTGAYGLDIGENITTLLEAVIQELPPHVMLRVGMTNPPYMLTHLDGIARALNHSQVFSFIHVPVQSGNDRVLTAMNREYLLSDFTKVCDYLLDRVPGLTLATDIICGFPGETDQEFADTLALVEKYRFRVVNISQFYARPGTAAFNMERTPTKKVKERSAAVSALFRSFTDRHKPLIGTMQRVIINETEQVKGTRMLTGHTKNYTKVVLPYNESLFGKHVLMRITEAFTWHVEGVIVDE